MSGFGRRRKVSDPWRRLIGRTAVSFICVCFAHISLYLISYFFAASNILIILSLSVIALLAMAGIGRICKRLLRLRASAPAFVFINLLFIWCVYALVIQEAVSSLLNVVFYTELILLLVGLYRILSSDPGYVSGSPGHEMPGPLYNAEAYSESSFLLRRVRYCKHCDAHVKGFDHHCPAFGNCIGQNNHVLFIVLVAGFIIAEACYIEAASKIAATSQKLDKAGRKLAGWAETLATSTMVFSLLQVLWQVVFLTWHIYCVCFNIRTDEWIRWKRYPEFQYIVPPQPGQSVTETRFTNPYDKGILQNVKEFLEGKG